MVGFMGAGRGDGWKARNLPTSGFLENIEIEKRRKYTKYEYQKLK
jgi:hypothetical protein